MHELSLAHSLIDQILGLAAEHQASRVLRVRVTLGPFSGVVRDSFEFGFNVLKKAQPQTAEAVLDLDTPDPTYVCLDCARVSVIPFSLPQASGELLSPSPFPKKCPWCDGRSLSPKGGTELILNQLEME